MSYCRWSSDDWRCDIYCYESNAGFEVHVAASRYHPLPPRITAHITDQEEWLRQYRAQREALDVAESVPIGLPQDGESFVFEDARDAAAKLRELRDIGYNVPEYAIQILEGEDKDEEEEKHNGH